MGFPNLPAQQAEPQFSEDVQGPENPLSQSSTAQTYLDRPLQSFTNSPIADVVYGAEGFVKNRDGSPLMSKEDVKQTYGTDVDGPVTQDYAEFKASQEYRQAQWADVLNKGGSSSANNTWLGFGVTQAASFLDPLQDAAALVPVTRLAGLAGRFGDTAAAGLAEHAVSGSVGNSAFSLAMEPFNYANDPKDWTTEGAAERLLTNALFGGIAGPALKTTGALAGSMSEYLGKSLTNAGEMANGSQAGIWDGFISRLQPETRVAMVKAVLGRGLDGKEDLTPVDNAVGLDQRILAHESELGGQALPMEERAEVLAQMDAGTYVSPRQAIANSIAERLTESELGEASAKLNEPDINEAVSQVQERARDIGASSHFTPEDKAAHVAAANTFVGRVNDYLGSQQHFPLDPDKTIETPEGTTTSPENLGIPSDDAFGNLPKAQSVLEGLNANDSLKQHKAERIMAENPQSVKAPTKPAPNEKALLANPANTKLRAIKGGVDALRARGNSPELKAGLQAYKNELARLQLPDAPVSPRDLATSRVNDIRDQMQQEQKAAQNPPRMQYGHTEAPLEKQKQAIKDQLNQLEKRPAPTEENPHPQTATEKLLEKQESLRQANNEAINCVTQTL